MNLEIHLYFDRVRGGVIPANAVAEIAAKDGNWISNGVITEETMKLIIDSNYNNVIFHFGEEDMSIEGRKQR